MKRFVLILEFSLIILGALSIHPENVLKTNLAGHWAVQSSALIGKHVRLLLWPQRPPVVLLHSRELLLWWMIQGVNSLPLLQGLHHLPQAGTGHAFNDSVQPVGLSWTYWFLQSQLGLPKSLENFSGHIKSVHVARNLLFKSPALLDYSVYPQIRLGQLIAQQKCCCCCFQKHLSSPACSANCFLKGSVWLHVCVCVDGCLLTGGEF